MTDPGNTTALLQKWLDILRAGDDRGRTELCSHACERLRFLARRMLRSYPLVQRWEQTDDVLQNAMLRLYRALAEVTPDSLRHFYNLAALQIRRELLDLSKRYARLDGQDEERKSRGGGEALDDDEPSSLASWSEFHRRVEALPDDEREVFALIWYNEVTQAEAAAVLDVSVRTVIRRWQSARIRLQQALEGKNLKENKP